MTRPEKGRKEKEKYEEEERIASEIRKKAWKSVHAN